MSIKNIKYLQPESDFSNYKITRSDIFYFLEFINYENELYNNNSTITSKPNIIFYKENNIDKLILDYSNANVDDKIYLKTFFTDMNQTTGISLISGSYLDETKGLEADLSSNLAFSEYKNNFVFATITSITNKNPQNDVYTNNFFITAPQISSGLSLTNNISTRKNAIVCIPVGNKTLENLGFYPGDLIEIQNPKSKNKDIKFKILDMVTLNKKQVIVLEQDASIETLIGQPTIVNLYQTQLSETIAPKPDINEQGVGNCLKLGKIIKFSTKYQCEFRGGNYFL